MANLGTARPPKSNRDNTNNCSIGFDSRLVLPPQFVPRPSMTAHPACNRHRPSVPFRPPPNCRRNSPLQTPPPRRTRRAPPPTDRATNVPSRSSPPVRAALRRNRANPPPPHLPRPPPTRLIPSIQHSSIDGGRKTNRRATTPRLLSHRLCDDLRGARYRRRPLPAAAEAELQFATSVGPEGHVG